MIGGVREIAVYGMAANAHVAIDGPVASGKTTVAKLLAKRLGYLYLDTGALYRAVALAALDRAIDPSDEPALLALLDDLSIVITPDPATESGYRVFINRLDAGDRLFIPEVSGVVSTVAAHPAVREALIPRQRDIADQGNVVMAGRDIGTVVLPDAQFKFFLTASLDERVRRRGVEFGSRGITVDPFELRGQIEERDRLDASRATAPLRAADDALPIDSSVLDPEGVVEAMLDRIGSASLSR